MAVYTKLTWHELNNFLINNYSIQNFIDYKEIIDGIDNSNFFIQTSSENLILTIFESRINADDLPFFMNLKLYLSKHQVPCPKPLKNNYNSVISYFKNKPAAIVTFLNGATLRPNNVGLYASITKKHCQQVGQILANFHSSVLGFKQFRENDLGIFGWRKFFNKISEKIENYQLGLGKEIDNYLSFLEKNWITDLTKIPQNNLVFGAIHADLFPDNVFFDEQQKLSGIIDFYFSCNDFFIYDLAITINAWCFDEQNLFDKEKYQAILAGYQEVKNLNDWEINFLRFALIGAALRFLLTRLNDLFFTPKNSLVKIKDPQEYLSKIRYFYQINKIC